MAHALAHNARTPFKTPDGGGASSLSSCSQSIFSSGRGRAGFNSPPGSVEKAPQADPDDVLSEWFKSLPPEPLHSIASNNGRYTDDKKGKVRPSSNKGKRKAETGSVFRAAQLGLAEVMAPDKTMRLLCTSGLGLFLSLQFRSFYLPTATAPAAAATGQCAVVWRFVFASQCRWLWFVLRNDLAPCLIVPH